MAKKKKSGLDAMDYAIGGGVVIMLASMLFKSKPAMTREQAIAIINQAGHPGNSTYETPYLIAWAMAIQKGENQFSVSGKAYSTLTGRTL